jgi:hypothetical protein
VQRQLAAPSTERPAQTPDPAPRARAVAPEHILALQRTAGNAAVSRLLARTPVRVGHHDVEYLVAAYWAPAGATAGINVGGAPGKRRVRMPVHAGTQGILRLRVIAQFTSGAIGATATYELDSWCEWHVTVLPDGRLEIGMPAPGMEGRPDGPIQPAGVPVPGAGKDSGEFTLTQGYVATAVTDQTGYVVFSRSGTDPAPTAAETFAVELDVQGVSDPHVDVKVSDVQVFQHQTHDVNFFNDGNVHVRLGERNKLMDWFKSLSPRTRQRLRLGQQKIMVGGYASNTGPADLNELAFAEPRLAAVKQILGRHVAPEAWIDTPFGEDARPGQDLGQAEPAEERHGHEHEDATRLIVRLDVEDDRTPGADDADPFALLPK